MAQTKAIKTALISVFHKDGLSEILALLAKDGVKFLSTGGTRAFIEEQGYACEAVEDLTGYPSILGGRVKTLHPKVFGGILGRRSLESDMTTMAELAIPEIDLVIVDLYPFEQTVASGASHQDIIEKIDIGGISLIRAAAKNFADVAIVASKGQYGMLRGFLEQHGAATTLEERTVLAREAFAVSSGYDSAIFDYMASTIEAPAGALRLAVNGERSLRYGENPHQAAAFYRDANAAPHSLACATQLNGKPLSYNNLLDTDAAWSAVREFDEPACIILKHQNPCGSAVAANVTEAYDKAYACDPVSAFGGIIACNREVPLELVEHFADVNKQFVEVLIAPSFTPEALERLSRRKNLRVLATGGVDAPAAQEMRTVDGGLLVQDVDHVTEKPADYQVVTRRAPTAQELHDLEFGWKVVKTVKSNAILIAKDDAGIGMGPGQPNRVDSAIIACDRAHKACERMGVAPENLASASDAFFPFRDDVDELAARGVTAIIQPGGSVRDEEVIAACDEHNIAMVFTGRRHFRH